MSNHIPAEKMPVNGVFALRVRCGSKVDLLSR